MVRQGNIRKSSTLPAVSSDTSRNACAMRWQITNDSITSALTRRRLLLEKTCRQTISCLVAHSARQAATIAMIGGGWNYSRFCRRAGPRPWTSGEGRALKYRQISLPIGPGLGLHAESPMLNRRKALSAAIGLIAAGGATQRARAQIVDKVVHIIVGFPPGGGTDIVA